MGMATSFFLVFVSLPAKQRQAAKQAATPGERSA